MSYTLSYIEVQEFALREAEKLVGRTVTITEGCLFGDEHAYDVFEQPITGVIIGRTGVSNIDNENCDIEADFVTSDDEGGWTRILTVEHERGENARVVWRLSPQSS